MKRWITIVVLTIVLVAGSVFFTTKMVYMTEQLTELKLSYANLQSAYEVLQSSHVALQSKHTQLESDYRSLESRYGSLESNYRSLESRYSSIESSYRTLRSDYDIVKGRMTELQTRYNTLEAEKRRLQTLLEQYEKVPYAYYPTGAFRQRSNTYQELCQFLVSEFILPRGYKVNVFDCSESAAYLEWALENAGFDAHIAVGRTPWNPSSGYHAWVIVYTKEYKVAIEATALTGEYKLLYLFALRIPGIVFSNDSQILGWRNYYEGYDNLLKNIYEAIRHSGSTNEWNWWEGYWGFR